MYASSVVGLLACKASKSVSWAFPFQARRSLSYGQFPSCFTYWMIFPVSPVICYSRAQTKVQYHKGKSRSFQNAEHSKTPLSARLYTRATLPNKRDGTWFNRNMWNTVKKHTHFNLLGSSDPIFRSVDFNSRSCQFVFLGGPKVKRQSSLAFQVVRSISPSL